LTFTIRRSTAVCLIAVMGILTGLALGQVSHAFSATSSRPVAGSEDPALTEAVREIKADTDKLVKLSVNSDLQLDRLRDLKLSSEGIYDQASRSRELLETIASK
jgi:hypothetical protein